MTAPGEWKRQVARLGDETLYLGLHRLLQALPTEVCSDVGARLSGTIGRKGHPVSEARSRVLLARLRPDWAEPGGLEAAVARTWANAGRMYAEYSVLNRLIAEGRATDAEPGVLAGLAAPGSPRTIFAFLHLGNWEIVAHRIAHLTEGRAIGLAAPPANSIRAKIVRRWHDTLPGLIRPTSPRVWREVMEFLKQPDGAVMVAIDEPNATSVSAPFFGRPVRQDGNLSKVVRMAAATGARIVPIYVERRPGVRFLVHAMTPVAVDPRARGPGAATTAEMMRIDAMIAPVIRRFADQWHMAAYFGKDVAQVALQTDPLPPA